MQLFDPERPTLASGRKCLLGTHRITGVPSFDIEPIAPDKVSVEVMLRYDQSTGFVWYMYECQTSELGQLFIEFVNDPEKTLREKFNWDPSKIIYEPKKVQQNFAPTVKPIPNRSKTSGPVDEDLDVMDLD